MEFSRRRKIGVLKRNNRKCSLKETRQEGNNFKKCKSEKNDKGLNIYIYIKAKSRRKYLMRISTDRQVPVKGLGKKVS